MKKFFHKYILLFGPVLSLILIVLDRLTKDLAVLKLKDKAPFVVWDGVFEFYYFENTGAAWGMLKEKQGFFYILTVVFCIVVIWEIIRIYKNPRFMPLIYTMFTVLAGALGNFYDRISFKYVVDFIYVKIINFPIFNLADCYITISVIILMLLLFFYYTDDEFEIMIPGKFLKK